MDTKLKNFVIQLLRRGTFKWEPRYTAKNNARAGQYKVNGKGREIWHYRCALCPIDKLYVDKDVVVDHRMPVVDEILGWQGFDVYIERMFCPIENFQVLCEAHHSEKTKKEQLTRKIIKDANKISKKK